jgi:hydrogenase maturation protein HypF
VRVINNRPVILRRARGYAPLPVRISENYHFDNNEILGVGGHLKNTIAIKKGNNIFVSQHIGDLSTETALNSFEKTIKDLSGIYSIDAKIVVSDLHPGYTSTKYADSSGKIIEKIQHHIAHIAACRIENQVQGCALGISWDGTGFGTDNTIWGGEFFLSDDDSFNRVGNIRTFNLPGSEAAVKEPRRSAFGILYEMYGDSMYSHRKDYLENVFSETEIKLLSDVIKKKINSPVTSSVGRLFDAVSSLLGLCHISNYEGQAAIILENTMDKYETGHYSYYIRESDNICVDWAPLIEEILKEKEKGYALEKISAKFHNTLTKIILDVSKIIGEDKILLSGGCFQNKILVEKIIKLLRENKFQVFSHYLIPPNDGGISFGQIAAYLIQNKAKHIQKKRLIYKQMALNKEIM